MSVPKELACVITNSSAKQCNCLSNARPRPFSFPYILIPCNDSIIFLENHAAEEVESCPHKRLGTIHSLDIHKKAWLKEELRGSCESEVEENDEKTLSRSVNLMQEPDFPTRESKNKFICESFKIDEN